MKRRTLLELHKTVRDPNRVGRIQRRLMWLWLIMGAFFVLLAIQFQDAKYSSNEIIPAFLAGLYAGLAHLHWLSSKQAKIFSSCLDRKKVEAELEKIGGSIPK